MITIFGMAALTFMMLMYTFEKRGRQFVLAFALGCALSSTYGFLSGAWPFGIVEAIWCLIAVRRYFDEGRRIEADDRDSIKGESDELKYPFAGK